MSIKLDHTYIVVRQRNILEIFDLTTQIVRDHAFKLLMALLVGAIPFAVVDFLILHRWMDADHFKMGLVLLACLVISQAPIGTAVITDYLGSVMFLRRANVLRSTRNVLRNYGKLLHLQGVVRGAILLTVLVAVMDPDWGIETQIAYVMVILGPVLCWALLIRGLRPFVTEVMLLEKPLWQRGQQELRFSNRSRVLHSRFAAELFGQALVSYFFAALLTICFIGLLATRSFVFGTSSESLYALATFHSLAFWLAAGFTTVARFLSYINLRIKQEGWEVELKLRAEANKYIESRLS